MSSDIEKVQNCLKSNLNLSVHILLIKIEISKRVIREVLAEYFDVKTMNLQ